MDHTMDQTMEVINLIKNSKKTTPVKVYYTGTVPQSDKVKVFDFGGGGVLMGDWAEVQALLEAAGSSVQQVEIESDRRNSAIPLLDMKGINARIEPGAIIRDKVEIGDNAVIMMGAVINIGCNIGEGTMIDMNATLGGRVQVGKMCHIGAGAVLAGVIEPPSAQPVTVEDDVVIGANAVVLEGVRIGKGSVVAAGAVVIEDVPENSVVAGIPAKVIKTVDDKTKSKTMLIEGLRNLK
ncbi:2,3,4,5-tetrahydropyridine-2,6-dicarboxylate N-acetyltransferase [Xylanibacillus composti]|uniref:2,3,4,5-tetrahydropyridine-2,6-dicarboxylate N-acetyltransferase n=1 Tax=Xylanibacillus composti TaxID=1572762 RepID=A0A8J4H1M7_9BACL|nr:2,3,4,5-tetrahydropyridine-2,6-dicarboxylate N-acetyltransferase [Xylanibacillus composti]MDT9724345.1 2,3,4,5-tetrahydropyridine-2,6-dicarboxylate N-acetyltransferase [Xylanibacillus composti]GIQ67936.1 2,3,4,5-tetrahydropyridine-2,6-dicarboxylate N-acetyltransferase [Xylanibacillus composti]